MRNILNVAICMIFLFFSTTGYAGNYSGKLALKKKFDQFSLNVETDYRYNNVGLYYRHYDFSIKHSFENNWSSSLNYRSAYKYKQNRWYLERRPHIQIQKVFDTKLLKVLVRTRQEYRYQSDGTESTRNRSRILFKSKKIIWGVKPFLANEWFYDMDDKKYNKNWLSSGIEFPKSKYGKYSIYYKHVTDLEENHNWISSYSIVLKLGYSF